MYERIFENAQFSTWEYFKECCAGHSKFYRQNFGQLSGGTRGAYAHFLIQTFKIVILINYNYVRQILNCIY